MDVEYFSDAGEPRPARPVGRPPHYFDPDCWFCRLGAGQAVQQTPPMCARCQVRVRTMWRDFYRGSSYQRDDGLYEGAAVQGPQDHDGGDV